LLGRELDERFAQAKRAGFLVITTTNGYWAINESAAIQRMERAAAAGLSQITLSTGPMHAPFVPPSRVVDAAIAAFDLGLAVRISIEETLDTAFDMNAIAGDRRILSRCDSPRMTLTRHPWIENPARGPAKKFKHHPQNSAFLPSAKAGCEIVLDDLTVTAEMDLVCCCGYHLDSIPDLHMGSVATRSLLEVVESYPDDFLKVMLHVAGPEMTLLFIKRFAPDYEVPIQNVQMCQSCLHLHTDAIAMRVFRENKAAVEKTITDLFNEKRARVPDRLPL
jgi:hypothetical protein